VDGERDAVLVVLAEVRDRAGERAGVSDRDDGSCGGGRGGGVRRGLGLLFLAARREAEGQRDGKAQLMRAIHLLSPEWGQLRWRGKGANYGEGARAVSNTLWRLCNGKAAQGAAFMFRNP